MISKFEADCRRKKNTKTVQPVNGSNPSQALESGIEDKDAADSLQLEWMKAASPQKRSADEMAEPQEPDFTEAELKHRDKMRKKHNKDVQKLAIRAVTLFGPVSESATKCMANKDFLPTWSVRELEQLLQEIDALTQESQVGQKVLEPNEELSGLSFDNKSLAQMLKGYKATVSQADQLLKVVTKAKGKTK